MKKNKQAFSLIELLVVILIIGILAAVALPQYKKAVIKSRMTEALAVLTTLRKASNAYYLANGEYPTDVSKLDVEIPSERISTQWAQGNNSDPRNYYYSCAATGDCAANAADEDMPLLSYSAKEGIFACIAPKNRWGINKSNMAEDICKSIGTYSLTFDQVDYYQIN